MRLSPDGAWALAVSVRDNTASLIDTHLLQLARTVTVGSRLRDVTFTADSHFAYVLGELDATVYRIAVPTARRRSASSSCARRIIRSRCFSMRPSTVST